LCASLATAGVGRATPAAPNGAPQPAALIAAPPGPPAEVTETTGDAASEGRRPASAAEALDRAEAAYEFGDLRQMIDLGRLVAEGALAGNDDQRARALRLLGIGLYLDGRADGAERAFVELQALRPTLELDPTVTRPEVVAFYREVRRRNRPRKSLWLAFLPPFGQFQNQTPVRGWIIGGLEVATLGAAVTSTVLLNQWRSPSSGLCRGGSDASSCENMKLFNHISVLALGATWAVGVVDALLNHNTDPESRLAAARRQNFALTILPTGAALNLRF
jgi:hypothetical protein